MPASKDRRVRFNPQDYPDCKSCVAGKEHRHWDALPVTEDELAERNFLGAAIDDGGPTSASAIRRVNEQRGNPEYVDQPWEPLTAQEAASRATPRDTDG